MTRAGRSWRDVTPRRALIQLEDVVFTSRLVGWVVTNDCAAAKALVHHTTDGGHTWRSAAVRPTNCAAGSRLDLSVADSRHAWILDVYENGNLAPLEHTVDGGRTWKEINANAPFMGSIEFTTPRDGWLGQSDFAAPAQLYETHDGGRSWRRRRIAAPRGWRGARLFLETPTFFGQRGVLPVDLVRGERAAVAFYTTTDGGRTWRPRSTRKVASSIANANNPFVRYVPTSIASPSVWWIAEGRRHSVIAVTRDAGRSWRASTPSTLPPAAASDISATDARHAWLTTSPQRKGAIYVTSDAGETWHRLRLPRP